MPRRHTLRAVLPVLALLPLAPSPARASADIDCYPDLRIAHAVYTRCNLMSVLSPGNDTRANLLLLLLDKDGDQPRTPSAPPLADDALPLLFWTDFRDRLVGSAATPPSGFARGEGSRCLSNNSGEASFDAAVPAAVDLPAEDKTALVRARDRLAPTCRGNDGDVLAYPQEPIHSATGQAFSTYLVGAVAFYAERFDEALGDFAKLHGSTNGWLADTADYMDARTLVNQMQLGAFDDYGDSVKPKPGAGASADRVQASLDAYLRGHPQGAYVASAHGLERRVDWVAGRTQALAARYAPLIAKPLAERGEDDAALAEEIAGKPLPGLAPATMHAPILLATLDLAALRAPDRSDDTKAIPPKRPDLESQRADFAAAMPLFDFLLATQAFYLEHDPAKVMRLVPDNTHRRGGDHLWFSRQVLRGLALEARDDRNARGFWKELFAVTSRPLDQLTVQLGLAMHDERAHTLGETFSPGTIVTSPAIRQILLEDDADAALLRRVAHDESTPRPQSGLALSTLLWKEVTRGHQADFLADLHAAAGRTAAEAFRKTYPGEIGCPSLAAIAARLDADPRARLCLAEFVRTSNLSFDRFSADPYGSDAKADELGGVPSMFPGKPYDRAATYTAVIANRAAPADDRAFALYRAILCWAPSGVNDCGGPDVPKAKRAAWYATLKRDYPASRWAKQLAYWW